MVNGLFLLVRSYKLKKLNVFYIGIAHIFIVLGFLGNLIFSLSLLFEEAFVSFGFFFVGLFTYTTFHKNREVSAKYILLLIIILLVIHYIFQIIFFINPGSIIHLISKIFDIISTFSVFGWMGFSSFFAYKRIKDENVKDWIKFRYKLISLSALILSVQAVPELFMRYDVEYGDPANLGTLIIFGFTLIFSLIFSIGFLIAWIFPKHIKKD
ncbi:MAG: hypothetical protein GF311_26005 [Candidatus Lokiarchaeota archaeon]|nr:hypothetical protein [Candidatus Lokiarchaeota archaeon]